LGRKERHVTGAFYDKNEIEGFALKQYPNMSVKIELRKPI
jgi:hypothetical protein